MQIWFFPDKDFSEIGRLRNLQELELIQCKTATLDGINDMPSLKKIFLRYSRTLQNIDALSGCPNLEEIWIEKCAKLLDINLKSQSLHTLHLDCVANLNFLPQLPRNMKLFSFADLKDGNMQPILDFFTHPDQVGFSPKRPHYQYTLDELLNLLAQKNGKYSEPK